MDPEIAELKRQVEELKAVAIDTNKMMHGMRRNQRWHSLGTIVWWLIIIAVSVWSYYFIQPYLQRAIDAYAGIQQNTETAQNWQQQAQDFYNKYFAQPTTTP